MREQGGIKFTEQKKESKKEKFPDHIKVFRVRHGDTEYKEQFKGRVTDNDMDLSNKGMEQIESSAMRIAERLDKENDIVWVVNSPMKRTRDSAAIIREYLRANGFNIWEDSKYRENQTRIRATDFLDDKGRPLEPGSKAYVKRVGEIVEKLNELVPEGMDMAEYYYNNSKEIEGGEIFEKVQERSRRQLKKFGRIARLIQTKTKKRIVIIQAEHGETMDELMEKASDGKATGKVGKGAVNAEVLELTIPTEGDKYEVKFIDREDIEPKKIKF